MRQLVYLAAFWLTVVVVVRLAVCFPRSLLARVLFASLDPARARGEPQSDYAFRCARGRAQRFAEAAFLFAAGLAALRWDASFADSMPFVVLWAIVVPILGVGWLSAAGYAFARFLWLRRHHRAHVASSA